MRGRGDQVVWPVYFDAQYTWRQGRRVSKSLAVRGVKVEEVLEAANDLGLNPVMEPGVGYSKTPWLKTGVVRIGKAAPKTVLLKDLAERIRLNRAQK